MVKCTDCGKEIPEGHELYCDMCGAPLCEECETTGLCSTCAELWDSEIDLEDMEEEKRKQKKRGFAGDGGRYLHNFTELPHPGHFLPISAKGFKIYLRFLKKSRSSFWQMYSKSTLRYSKTSGRIPVKIQ